MHESECGDRREAVWGSRGSGDDRALQLATLTDGSELRPWHSWLLRSIRDRGVVWCLTVRTSGAAGSRQRSPLAWTAYQRFDRRRYGQRAWAARGSWPTAPDAGAPPQVDLRDARELDGLGVDGSPADVLLDVRDRPEPVEGLSARFGRWWIQVRSPDGRPLPSVGQALIDGERLLQIRLLAELPGAGEETVLAVSTTRVLKQSVVLAEAYCQWRGADLVSRCLDRILSPGWEPEQSPTWSGRSATPVDDEPTPADQHASGPRAPSNSEVLRWSGGLLATRLRHLGQHDSGPRWILGVRSRSAERSPSDARGYSALVPPADRFYADPFVVEVGGRHFLFFEDASIRTGFGVISVVELEGDGTHSDAEVVLERPYHLSYPCVFTSGSDVFMIPETFPNRTIELYRAVEFPRRWVLERVLLDDVQAADPTILSFDGLYWLFANVRTPSTGGYDEVSVYFSETLDGTWSAHPRNPVVSDVRRARPAGRLFETAQGLWRPAQDCSRRYGGAVAFQNVTTLTEEEYEEVPVGGLEPAWEPGLVGVHTYNSDSLYEVVDGLRSDRWTAVFSRWVIPPRKAAWCRGDVEK